MFRRPWCGLIHSCCVPSEMSHREDLESRLAEIPGVVRRPARRGHGHTYFAGDREIAHFHGDERVDVRLRREWIRRLKAEHALDERVRTRGPTADWVAVNLRAADDLMLVVSLVREAVRTNAEHRDGIGNP